jgi:hypothetical protein
VETRWESASPAAGADRLTKLPPILSLLHHFGG